MLAQLLAFKLLYAELRSLTVTRLGLGRPGIFVLIQGGVSAIPGRAQCVCIHVYALICMHVLHLQRGGTQAHATRRVT